jgi:ABC-type Zn uptake system ZnuABC Zn-binding protein ZnuA
MFICWLSKYLVSVYIILLQRCTRITKETKRQEQQQKLIVYNKTVAIQFIIRDILTFVSK